MQLPHELNRKNQLEAFERVRTSDKKFIVLCLKTGSGKSAIAAALAALDNKKTMVLVLTKSLQAQYANQYEFTNLFGKGNYECLKVYDNQPKLFDEDIIMADLCVCPKEDKQDCYSRCPYPLARQAFVDSIAGVTNYHKFVSDRGITLSTEFTQGFNPEYLFLDEGHKLSDLTVDYAGITLSWKSKRLLEYCQPIYIDVNEIDLPEEFAKTEAMEQAIDWLVSLQSNLKSNPPKHPSEGGDAKKFLWHKRLLEKLDITLLAIQTEPQCWFVHSNEYGMTIKPLTAKYHFSQIFDKAPKIVIMSATIQPRDIVSLGLTEFEFISFPNPIKAEMRPVYDLNCPPITHKSTSRDYLKQAEILANVFQSKPDYWNGMLHFPSKQKTWDCANLMTKMTGRPVYVPDEQHSTDEAYSAWLEFEQDNTGAIACVWQFDTGIDAGNVNINICAGVPYPNFGDRYEKARFDYSPGEARIRVANALEQIMGRNRRGFDEHYGPFAEKFNGIADGKWVKLRSAFDKDFIKSIV